MTEELKKLENKHELVSELLNQTNEAIKKLEESMKRLEGYSYGAKEISNKFEEFIKKKKEELTRSIQQGTTTQPAANIVLSSLGECAKFLKNESYEIDKIFHVRQGEFLSTKNQKGMLENTSRFFINQKENIKKSLEQKASEPQSSIENDEDIPIVFDVQEDVTNNTAEPVKVTERIRPDKNPNTKIGRAAMDLMERKKKALEGKNDVVTKRGRKRKI